MSTALQFVTLGVPSLGEAQALFENTMGFVPETEYAVGTDLERAWLLPSGSQARALELSCGGYATGRIRLLQSAIQNPAFVRHDHGGGAPDTPLDIGPKAIDFYVPHPIAKALDTLRSAGLKTRSSPVRYEIDGMESEEVLLTGPGKVPLLLMVGHTHTSEAMRTHSRPVPFSEVATVSVVCGGPERSRQFYEGVLGLESRIQAYVEKQHEDLVCRLTGAPKGTRMYFQLYGAAGEPSGKVLLVHFENTGAKRLTQRMRPGNLGFSMMSFVTDDLAGVAAKSAAMGLEILSGPVDTSADRQTLLIRGPNEECVELTA